MEDNRILQRSLPCFLKRLPLSALLCLASCAPEMLHTGEVRRGSIARGERKIFSVELGAHQYCRIRAVQHEIDFALRARDISGKLLAEMDGSEFGYEVLSFVSAAAGRYEVVIESPADTTKKGSYEVRVEEVRTAQKSDSADVEAQKAFMIAASRTSGGKHEQDVAIAETERVVEAWSATESARTREAHARLLLGKLFHRAADWRRAETEFRAAVALYSAAGDEANRLQALTSLTRLVGHLHRKLSDVPNTMQFVEMWRKQGDRRGIAQAVSSVAGRHQFEGRIEESLRMEREALALRTEIGDEEGRVRCLEGILGCLRLQKQSHAALQIAKEILELRQRTGNRRGEAAAWSALGVLFDGENDDMRAVDCYRKAATMHRELGDPSAEVSERKFISGPLARLGRFEEAERELELGLAVQEQIRAKLASPAQAAMYHSASELEDSFMTLLLREGGNQSERMFRVAEKSYEMFGNSRVELAEVRARLGEDDLLLEYWLGEQGGNVWSITREKVRYGKLPKLDEISKQVQITYDALVRRGSNLGLSRNPLAEVAAEDERAQAALRELSRMLLGPVAEHLRKKRIFVVGNIPVHSVPFGLLTDPQDRSHVPLSVEHEVVYLTSASELVRGGSLNRRDMAAVVVADPLVPRRSGQTGDLERAVRAVGVASGVLGPLHYTREEAESVRQFVPARVLSGAQATATKVMQELGQAKLLHFATHALVNLEDPDISGLLLSPEPGSETNGFVRLTDIQKMKLQAELVVLSACRTAQVVNPRTGPLVSLASAFLRAGARQVLGTAWKVDDEATSVFMKLFYEELLRKRREPVDALRAAQKRMTEMPRWRAPYYWGGFVLYQGSGRSR